MTLGSHCRSHELLSHQLALCERHLKRLMPEYVRDYDMDRTHLRMSTTNAYEAIGRSNMDFHAGASKNPLVQIRFAYSNMQSDLAPLTALEIERESATKQAVRTIEITIR